MIPPKRLVTIVRLAEVLRTAFEVIDHPLLDQSRRRLMNFENDQEQQRDIGKRKRRSGSGIPTKMRIEIQLVADNTAASLNPKLRLHAGYYKPS